MVDQTGAVSVAREVLDDAPVPTLQPSLFPASEIGGLPAGHAARADALRARGAGRPPGARNKRTQVFREYVLARGGHPADVLIEAYSRPVHDLARELGCSALEAFKVQQDAAKTILEYTEGRMPVTVKHDGLGAIPVIFEGFGSPGGAVVEGEFFQPLSDDESGELDKGELDSDR